jgi:hypothetical protein
MHTTTETTETNWAPALTDAVQSAGFTITGVPDYLNREQVLELGQGILAGVLERTPATLEGFTAVAVAVEAIGVTLPDPADRAGVGRRTSVNDRTSAELGLMARTAGTMLAERRA